MAAEQLFALPRGSLALAACVVCFLRLSFSLPSLPALLKLRRRLEEAAMGKKDWFMLGEVDAGATLFEWGLGVHNRPACSHHVCWAVSGHSVRPEASAGCAAHCPCLRPSPPTMPPPEAPLPAAPLPLPCSPICS